MRTRRGRGQSDLQCDNTWETGVRALDDKEGVDCKAGEDVCEHGEHERVLLLDPVGSDGSYEEDRGNIGLRVGAEA